MLVLIRATRCRMPEDGIPHVSSPTGQMSQFITIVLFYMIRRHVSSCRLKYMTEKHKEGTRELNVVVAFPKDHPLVPNHSLAELVPSVRPKFFLQRASALSYS
jgi:hypothetical protein